MSSPVPRTAAGAALVALGLLSLAPFPILGPALGWPGSLDDPAATMLPKLIASPEAVHAGYGLYLLYSVLFVIPVAVVVRLGGGVVGVLGTLAIAFAALSVFGRSLGILRWLTAMPDLAGRMPGADAATTAAIAIQYEALNHYAGAIGEVLGVGLFAGGALGLAAWAGRGSPLMPRWVLVATLIVAAIQVSAAGTVVGLPGASVMIVSTAFNLWLLVVGAWLVVSRTPTSPVATVTP